MVLLQSHKPLSVHSPRAFEKSDKTKKKPASKNINQEQNSDTRAALADASKAGSRAMMRVRVTKSWEYFTH